MFVEMLHGNLKSGKGWLSEIGLVNNDGCSNYPLYSYKIDR